MQFSFGDLPITKDYYRQLQIMKSLLPHLPIRNKEQLLILISIQEMRYLMVYCHNKCLRQYSSSDIFEEIKRHCTKEENEQLNQITDMLELMSLMKELNDIPSTSGFSGSSDDTQNSTEGGNDRDEHFSSGQQTGAFQGFDMMSMLEGMLSPAQQAMFQQFTANNHHKEDNHD